MDDWEAILDSHHDPPDVRSLSKVLHVAENIIKKDLAGFEIDWILQTLLYKPINLLDIIRSKRTDDVWNKSIGDAYKLLGDIVSKYPQNSEHWIDDIVQICEIPLDARTRVYALGCLSVCARRVAIPAGRYIMSIQDTAACRAPLAVLIGTICEYHPETVSDDAINIWRIYLNILDSNKNTDTIINAVLQGLLGLFKHFGLDLPVVELEKFYQKMSREYVKINKCYTVIQTILKNHSILFQNALAKDVQFRTYMWTCPDFASILPTVYKCVLSEVSKTELQNIINTELLPQTVNYNSYIKYAALRVIYYIHKEYNINIDILNNLDIYTLEFELKNQVDNYKAEAITFCLECNLPNSEKVLQTAILFYDNLPSNKRMDIVVDNILNASSELMNVILNFLVTESCRINCLNKYLPLWKDVLESSLKGKKLFFIIYMKNLIFVLDMFLDEDEKKLPEKLSSLLTLTSHVLTLTPPEDYTTDQCASVSRKLAQLFLKSGIEIPIVEVVKGLGCHLRDDDEFAKLFQMLQIDRCKDETLLCEMSLALLHAPNSSKDDDVERIIRALEVIFTRKDAEPNTLSLAMKKLEFLLVHSKNFKSRIVNIINLVEKLRTRKDLIGKEARILQREVTLFLGKYSNYIEKNNNTVDFSFAIELKDKFHLNIPNTIEGVTYKMNICRQMLLAIENQNEDTLHMMLTILCANSQISSVECQHALGALLASCARSFNHDRVVDAAYFCTKDAVDYIIEYLHNSSPGVRKMLCDVIEGILLKDPSSTNELMIKVADSAILLLSSFQSNSKQIGLDMTEALLSALKENNEQTKSKLLQIISLITITNEIDTYSLIDKASNLLTDKIELFTAEELTSYINRILLNSLKNETKDPISAKNYEKTIKSIVELIKHICDAKSFQIWPLVECLLNICQNDFDSDKCLRVIAELAVRFDGLMTVDLMELNDGLIERLIFDGEFVDEYQLDNVLFFVCQFADVLLESNRKQLKRFLSELTTNMTPKNVKYLKRQLSSALSKCHGIIDIDDLSVWTESLDLEEITNNLEKNIFVQDHFDSLTALRIMIDVYNLSDASVTLTFVNTFAQKWPRIILKMFSLGYVRHLTVELSFLTDLLSVSLKFLTLSDLKDLIREGHNLKGVKNERLGVEFCGDFINVFVEYLLKKPFLLLDDILTDCVVIVNDIVKIVVKKKMEGDYENLFELIDNVWPKYDAQTDFKTKHQLLLDISFLDKKFDAQSTPMIWAKNKINDGNISINEKVLLIGVLPSGDEFSSTYRKYASLLPTRLSEVRGSSHSVLRAMIDAVSVNGDHTLLDIISCLAAGDNTKGWWDDALPSCMASLAQTPYVNEVYNVIYKTVFEGLTTGVCTRLLVPLIRYSTPNTVTNFTSNKMEELLKILCLKRTPSQHYAYHKHVADVTRVLHLFVAVLEKVPPQHIESPTSPLYEQLNRQTDKCVSKPWHLPRELGKICCTLREVITQKDTHLIEIVSDLQKTAFNCLCASITLWKPDEKIYKTIFDLKTWEKIVDSNEEYHLPIRTEWNTMSVTLPTAVRSNVSCGSNRTRLFLRTLSENPLLYDLIDDKEDEQIETLEITLPSTELNAHSCASTLSSVLVHVAELGHRQWLTTVNDALTTGSKNLRWLLAQIIYNIKDELKLYGDELSDGLFTVILDTCGEINGRKQFNGLHVDIINTILNWSDVISNPNTSHLNKCTELFIHTLVGNRNKQSIHRYLLNIFDRYIDSFGKYISLNWSVFEGYINDTSTSKSLLPILTKITKNSIHIPELLPALLTKLSTNSYQLSKVAELIGLSIKCDSRRVGDVKVVLDKLRRTNVNDYVKLVYYSKYCDEQHFRFIVDIAQKLPIAEKNKCIDIIHTYMCQHPDADVLEEVPSELMTLVDEKGGGRRFEEFFQNSSTNEPQAKRIKTETKSLILNTVGRNEKYFNNLILQLGKEKLNKVLEKLSMDMSERDNKQFSKLSTRTKTYVGSLKSYSYSTTRRNVNKKSTNNLDVQISIGNILDTFIEFSKVSIEASMDLLKQLFICIKNNKLDNISLLGYMVHKIMMPYPIFLDFSRVLVDSICEIDGILDKMEQYKLATLSSDIGIIVTLLYEDITLRKLGPEQFVLGITKHDESQDIVMSDENNSFSFEEMVSAFKKLSNWDDLTIRERHIQSEGLPKLWSDKDSVINCIETYTETATWFGKMVALHKNKKQDVYKWLREAERSPRRLFEISALAEAIQWYDDTQTDNYHFNINNNDCLVEWAARLLIRSAHLSLNEDSQNNVLSRSNELVWCKRATEMEVPKLALQCIKRNTVDLFDYETLPWLEQRVTALKLMGFKQNDSQLLKKALDTADKYTPIFQDKSSLETVIGMNSLILELSYELKSLNTSKLDTIMAQTDTQLTEMSKKYINKETKAKLNALYTTAMLFYNDLWMANTDSVARNEYLKSMLPVIKYSIEYNLQMRDHFISMLMNEIENFHEIDSEIISTLIPMIKMLIKNEPTLFTYILKSKLKSHPTLRLCIDEEVTVDMYNKCLQLISDPEYTLRRYVHELEMAATENDPETYNNTFIRMKTKIFDNPYIGNDYQPLMKYKNKLYDTEKFESTDFTKKREVLSQIRKELENSSAKNILRLSQLCPKLTELGPEEGLSELLGLKKDEVIVKFDEQVHVYIDSVIRPCVLTALLSNGKRVKFLIKQVNMWKASAAMTVSSIYPIQHRAYNIIPLSEDCGVIQFLENHLRLQEMIAKTINLDDIPIVRQAMKEDELILATRQSSLSNYRQICEKIPSHTLRTAIENKCTSVHDFINKRNEYLNTLCTMTVLNYLFGIGDRHLENILYNIKNGGLQIIDMDSLFQYGVAELPPARLTRNILAVIDSKVLESRLQSKIKLLRKYSRFLLETIKFTFQNNDKEFEPNVKYLGAIMNGTKLSYQITSECLNNSNKVYKDKYIELLEEVFEDFEVKNQYTVEEQVSSLLLQCTDPRILSITRTGWEPWL